MLLAFLLVLLGPARAGTYSYDDLLHAVQRGLPATVLETIAMDVGPVTVEQAVRLLRAGASVDDIRTWTSGAHPSQEEIEAAAAAGPLDVLGPPMYSALSGRAWLSLLGVDLVLKTTAGEIAGRLDAMEFDELRLTTPDQSILVRRVDVLAVRRSDGHPIVTRLPADLADEEAAERIAADEASGGPPRVVVRNGRGLRTGGAVLLGAGIAASSLALIAASEAQSQLSESDAAVATGDVNRAADAADSIRRWSNVYYVSLMTGPGMIGGGVAMFAVGVHQGRR